MKIFNVGLMSLASVVFFFGLSCSEREINSAKLQQRGDDLYYAVNEEKPYSGKVVETYESGQKRTERTFKNGKLHGLSIRWDSDGQNRYEISYKNGQKSGPCRTWYGNGQQEKEGAYKGGKEYGRWVYWYDDGQKQRECNYKDGILDGPWISWSDKGEHEKEGTYKGGKEYGQWVYWYANGQKQRECNYKDGILDGLWHSWYDKGNQEKEGAYKDGKEHGQWVYWYANGQKQRECNYKDGILDGPWDSWYDKGNQEKEGAYKSGKEYGQWVYWYPNEQKWKEGRYKDGKQDGEWNYWTEDGWRLDIVKDTDGNTYQTIMIGNQVWMAENLKVTHYRNGDAIPNVTGKTAWGHLRTGAWCNYANIADNAATYGRLYNWYAVNDPRGITPEGWHVPTDAEWQTLIDYLGGPSVAGGKMKESGKNHWNSPNTNVPNRSGFSGLLGGFRYSFGNYGSMGTTVSFWSSSDVNSSQAWTRYLSGGNSKVNRRSYGKQGGFSVRCVKD